ncbi:hypothetical protein PHYBLDRAFT_147304 [Phycomyces blakesleeanus NRRL 1555(-)]|uniref:Uncharacterized protein n=2 Tax=Phycomyces blakesleeanus TaxID=4837 RepID=A0A163DIY6_PHYB8|nr:hypothetical protein PHYBLDRAFT_147304 [Phycomyces blakesleeanus NRRL 1555(-)]OAD71560.1 hypothetical protein PHYBLDRAFT_147304 [Phycomyces blakesleeanus NRRL 1555(-)]|eukprot:XP_018289600.1 hypothetical protein PHYBLDRAFT_147304 [Phycomyces blakesleeanus NRRL 1555(-)]
MGKALKKRERNGGLVAVTIDEYNTETCNNCQAKNLAPANHTRSYSVQVCRICNTLWQRDVNDAKNMITIAFSTWRGTHRQTAFQSSDKGKQAANSNSSSNNNNNNPVTNISSLSL